MKTKRWISIIAAIALYLSSALTYAATLTEVKTAILSYHASGDITDPDVYKTLSDLVNEAMLTQDIEAQNALRGTLIDMCYASRGSGVSETAADDIIEKAKP